MELGTDISIAISVLDFGFDRSLRSISALSLLSHEIHIERDRTIFVGDHIDGPGNDVAHAGMAAKSRDHCPVICHSLYGLFFRRTAFCQRRDRIPLYFHELDQAIASEDVLLLGEDDGADIGVPLRYFFNKQLFIIPRNATGEQVRDIFGYFLNNSGSKYGRILLLSRGWGFRFLRRTVERSLIYTDTVISNSEHWRSGGFASHEPGRMILPYAWHTANVPYSLDRVNALIQAYLPLGCPVDFSKGGNSELFVERGWSGQEAAYRWTDGPNAVLRVRIKQPTDTTPPHRLLLDFQAIPFGASQRATVTVDGQQVAELNVTAEEHQYEVEVSLDKLDIDVEHRNRLRVAERPFAPIDRVEP